MRWLSLIALFACVATLGCRNNNSDRAYLYQELREQEDEIYALEDMLDQYESKLASSRRANESLRREISGGAGGDDDPSRSSIPQTFQPPRIDFVPPSTPDTDAPPYVPTEPLPAPSTLPMEAPDFEMPGPDVLDPSEDANIRQSSYNELSAAEGGQSGATSLLNFRQKKEEAITDYKVDHITLNRQLTGGHNRDKLPGDEGVYIVVEPRNKAKQVIDVPGELTIVVMDPLKRGPEGRIARWDYTAEESANSFRQSMFGRGMHLELPWPGEAPQADELNLYVRFVTDDGRRLIAEKAIRPDPLPSTEYAEGSSEGCEDCLSDEDASERDHASEVAQESHDSWRRRTRSFRSLIPAPTGETQAVSLGALREREPAIGIPTTASTANFDTPVDVDLTPGATRETTQAARVLQTAGVDTPAESSEEVPYEFGPKRPELRPTEPEPRVVEEPAVEQTARRRVKWSPYR